MKIRSSLLVACIVVVPLVAMFSHRIPPDARAAFRELLRGGAVEPRRPPAPLVVTPAPASPVAAEPALTPIVPEQPAPVQPAVAALAADTESRAAPAAAPVSHAEIGAAGDGIEELRALGAVAIECRPLQGSGGHVASCRMPVDGAGQLERLFQATGVDATAAFTRLLSDVNQWRRNAGSGPQRTMRF